MRRVRLHSKNKTNIFTFILLLILSFIISLFVLFSFVGKNLSIKVEEYSMIEAKKIITNLINKSIEGEVIGNLKNNLFTKEDKTVDFDSYKINRLIVLINNNLKTNLLKLEKGEYEYNNTLFKDKTKTKKGIVYEIPSGIIFNNALLANIGPKIPVKLHMLGDSDISISSKIKDYGINNAIIELFINIKVSEQMVLPFSTKKVIVEESIPLALKLIEGNIPSYYSNIPLSVNDSSKIKK